jgi:hypothetical protein
MHQMTTAEIIERQAVREFLYFWERSICADKHYRDWLDRVMGCV